MDILDFRTEYCTNYCVGTYCIIKIVSDPDVVRDWFIASFNWDAVNEVPFFIDPVGVVLESVSLQETTFTLFCTYFYLVLFYV